MNFCDLKFNEIRPQHFQAKRSFGNYDLSVIQEPGKKLYEIAVFKNNNFVQLPGIHTGDDVIPYLEPADVEGIMLKLHFIAGPN
ncbi:hypothetical protein N9E09_00340 [bacterium]|jgi:hypothetical protein|nr:hypothetical protein [bacterium]